MVFCCFLVYLCNFSPESLLGIYFNARSSRIPTAAIVKLHCNVATQFPRNISVGLCSEILHLAHKIAPNLLLHQQWPRPAMQSQIHSPSSILTKIYCACVEIVGQWSWFPVMIYIFLHGKTVRFFECHYIVNLMSVHSVPEQFLGCQNPLSAEHGQKS